MAWSSISDLEAWYYQSFHAGNAYWKDIVQSTNSGNMLDIDEARKRSPLYMTLPKKEPGTIEIYAGINDGYTGSVSILHSILFYNKMAGYFSLQDGIVSDKEIITLLSRTVKFDTPKNVEYLDTRKVIYKKLNPNIGFFVFDGTHEMLPDYAFNRIKEICLQ
jgi:hypothetical protein